MIQACSLNNFFHPGSAVEDGLNINRLHPDQDYTVDGRARKIQGGKTLFRLIYRVR